MMRSTGILKDGHKAIKTVLKIAESVSSRLEKGESVPAEHLREILTFISRSERRAGRGRMWHYGETVGFRTAIQRFPDDRLTIVVLRNRADFEARALALKEADLNLGSGRSKH